MRMSEYLKEIILDPLGMTNSAFTLPEDQLANNWAQIYGLPTPNNPAIGQIGGTGIDWKIAEIDGNERVERQTFSLCPYGMADTDPRYQFDSGGGGITVVTGTGSTGTIAFADGTSGADQYDGSIDYNHSTRTMGLHTGGGSRRITILEGGNVGIGTASPEDILHVYGCLLYTSDAADE